jgi:hypothetical protein
LVRVLDIGQEKRKRKIGERLRREKRRNRKSGKEDFGVRNLGF